MLAAPKPETPVAAPQPAKAATPVQSPAKVATPVKSPAKAPATPAKSPATPAPLSSPQHDEAEVSDAEVRVCACA